jgi:hypothetical protein
MKMVGFAVLDRGGRFGLWLGGGRDSLVLGALTGPVKSDVAQTHTILARSGSARVREHREICDK